MLLSITVQEWCGLSGPWLYMSAYFERNKSAYMDLLLSVSTKGTWTEWIEFCLEGAVFQANDAEKRCDQLLKLHKDYHRRIKAGSIRLAKIVDALFEVPVVSVKHLRDILGVTHPTVRADLRKLESMKIVEEIENFGQLTYYCPDIYGVTYEAI